MRHRTIVVLAAVLAAGSVAAVVQAAAKDKKEARKVPAVLQFKMKDINSNEVDLSKYQGKVLLIVNTASQCGYTPQYKDLQALHEKYSAKGLNVLGFPCNQFGGQEPGDEKQIKSFCTKNYGVAFTMFSKIDVNGEHRADLYKYLTSKAAYAKDAGDVKWNFEKFLIGRDGKVIARYRSKVNPSSEQVTEAIEKALTTAGDK